MNMIRMQLEARVEDITTEDDVSRVQRAVQLVERLSLITITSLSAVNADYFKITAIFTTFDEERAEAFEDVVNSLTVFTVTRLP